MNKYGFVLLNESNAQELAHMAEEAGALAFRGQLQYPGPETGDWELGTDVVPDILYELRDREVLLKLVPDGGLPLLAGQSASSLGASSGVMLTGG